MVVLTVQTISGPFTFKWPFSVLISEHDLLIQVRKNTINISYTTWFNQFLDINRNSLFFLNKTIRIQFKKLEKKCIQITPHKLLLQMPCAHFSKTKLFYNQYIYENVYFSLNFSILGALLYAK